MEYRALTGINYPDPSGAEQRAERGDMVRDLPESAVAELLAAGAIEVLADENPWANG